MEELALDRDRFGAVWMAGGARNDVVFDELERRYAESGRHYHTAEHIAECLAWLDRARRLARDPHAVELALWFHDAVHDALAGDNEIRSAALFRRAARDAGVRPACLRTVCFLIEATDHQSPVPVGDASLLVDIDLSILGAAPARYRRYERDVRAEYRAVSDDRFWRARLAVLRGFLERTAIFRTPYFYDRLENQARENLAEAVRELQAQAVP